MSKKKGPGRPTKYSKKIAAEICRLIAKERMWLYEAAEKVGVHEHTIMNWEKKNPEFLDALKGALERKIARCLRLIEEASDLPVGAKNWQAAAWICERTYPERFSLTHRVDLKGDMKQRMTLEQAHEELARIEAEIAEDKKT